MIHNTILVDMDGVFADFVGSVYSIFKEQHPEHVLPDPSIQSKFYMEDWVDDPELKRLIEHVTDTEPTLFQRIEPFEGAIDGMKLMHKLASQHSLEVIICTAPHKQNKPGYTQKAEWVEKHFGQDWLNRLIMARDKTLIGGLVLIDDKPEPLGRHTPSWQHIVFDRCYNRHISQPRMLDWSPASVENVIQLATQRRELPYGVA